MASIEAAMVIGRPAGGFKTLAVVGLWRGLAAQGCRAVALGCREGEAAAAAGGGGGGGGGKGGPGRGGGGGGGPKRVGL